MKTKIFFPLLVCVLSISAYAQVAGDYRSATTGNWGDVATWEYYDGTNWVSASNPPDGTSGTITIRTGDTVTVASAITINGATIVVNGYLKETALITKTSGTWIINGTFELNHPPATNQGLPTATWNTGSTCKITGITNSTAGLNAVQDFHHLEIDCPAWTGNLNFGWGPGTTRKINGNLVVKNTGSGRFQMHNGSAGSPGLTVNIYGNIIVDGSASSASARADLTSNGTSTGNTHITINVYGNVIVTGNPTNTTWTNFSISRGSQGGNGTSIWNFHGDVSVSNAQIQNSTTTTGGGIGKFVFAKNGEQSLTFTNLNTTAAPINIEVLSGSILNIGSSTLTPSSGFFTLSSSAGIITSHPSGLNGNLTNTGEKILSTGANYVFNGTSVQVTGTLMPATVNNLTINNSAGVTLSGATTVNGTLTLTSGALSIGANTLTINGALDIEHGNLAGGSTSNLTIGGFGTGLVLPAVSLNNLTMLRASGLSLGGNVTVNGTLTLENGIITTGDNILSVAQGGNVSRNAGYVIGTLQKYLEEGSNVPLTLELGTSNGYAPVNFTFASVSPSGNISCRIVEAEAGNIEESGIDPENNANIHWIFNSDAGIDVYEAVLNFDPDDLDPNADAMNFVAWASDDDTWSKLSVTGNSQTSIKISGSASQGNLIAIGEPVKYRITAIAGPNGSIDPSGEVIVNYGDNQTFIITPDPTYRVDSVLVDEVKVDSTTSYTFTNVTSDHTIRAVFAKIQHPIIATAGPNGTIIPSGTVMVDEGADQEFLFQPATRYKVDSVIVDGVYVGSPSSYTFYNVTTSHTIRVTFAPYPLGIISNGTGGGNWNSPGTWIGGMVPLSVDTVIIATGDSVFLTSAGNCAKLILQPYSKLALNASGLPMPGSSWQFDVTSTVYYNGPTTVSAGPIYGNLVYSSADNGGPPANSTVNIAGNLTVTRATFRGISATSGTNVINVAGNVYLPGANSRISAVNSVPETHANCTWNIGGSVYLTGNNSGNRIILFESAGGHTGSAVYNINGNLSIGADCRVDLRSSTQATASGTGIINIKGNISNSGNIRTNTGNAGILIINLNGTSAQQWTGFFPITFSDNQSCIIQINNGAGVTLNNNVAINANNSLEVLSGALFNLGTCVVSGVGPFNLNAGASLASGHTSGLNGNLTTSGTKTLSPDANYIFNGLSAQATGTLIPSEVNNLIINNSSNVTLSKSVTVKGILSLENGKVITVSNILAVADGGNVSRTNGYVVGTLQKYLPQGASIPVTFEIGTPNGYSPAYAELLNVITAGTMSATIVPGDHPDIANSGINATKSVNQYWVFLSTAQFLSYNGTLNFVPADVDAGVEPMNFIIQAYNQDNNPAWTSLTVTNRTETSIEFTGEAASGGIFAIGEPKSGELVKEIQQVPREFKLSQNYPNPFNPITTIEFTVPEDGIATLAVYSLLGQKVATLFNGEAKAGVLNRVIFNASKLSSGIYFYKLEFGNQTSVRKLVLMK